jgi:integrase
MAQGIRIRHSRWCRSPAGERCNCQPSFEAAVYLRPQRNGEKGEKIRKTFVSKREATAWRHDAVGEVRRGKDESADAGDASGGLGGLGRGGEVGPCADEVRRPLQAERPPRLEQAMRDRVLPDLGGARLSEIRRVDVQDLVDRLQAAGLDASTIRNAIAPLRAVYRRAFTRGEVAVNPTAGLELPAVRGKRDRIASPDEAGKLLAALPQPDRALWATAMYGGLRRGELMALRWEDVDLAAGRIRVERSWDPKEGVIAPKSGAGVRTVPIAVVLRDFLDEHALRTRNDGLVFGRSAETPFDARTLSRRAETAWKNEKPKALEPISLHECRHSFASLMIAAGVNAKALSSYMGHSSITITLVRLMPGNEEEAAGLLDAFLERSNTAARLAQIEATT